MVKRKIYKALSVAMASSMLMATPSPALVNAKELPEDTTEEVVEELKEDSKDETKENSKEEVKEDSKKEAEESKEEVKEDSKEESEENTEEAVEEKDSEKEEKDDEESKKTCEITYSMFDFDDSYEGGSWGSTVTKSKGGVKIEYSGNYAEKVFGLPKGIKGTDVVSVKANLLKGSKSGFSLKFRNKGEEVKAAYGTDVIENTSKAIGIKILIRTMAPKVIIADEIGNEDDSIAINYAMCSGCKGIFSAHGSSFEDLYLNNTLKKIINLHLFEVIIFLSIEKNGKEYLVYSLNKKSMQYEKISLI